MPLRPNATRARPASADPLDPLDLLDPLAGSPRQPIISSAWRMIGLAVVSMALIAVGLTPARAAQSASAAAVQTVAAPSRVVAISAKRVLPVNKYRISAWYGATGGPHSGRRHGGVDFAANHGKKVRAVRGGRVVQSGWAGSAGRAVTIRTKYGKRVLYGHLSRTYVRKGMRIRTGRTIGRVGSTGNSTGPHLHLQVHRRSGRTMDPVRFLKTSHARLRRLGQ